MSVLTSACPDPIPRISAQMANSLAVDFAGNVTDNGSDTVQPAQPALSQPHQL